MKCDFSGYATKNDLRCTDGRTIRRGAFSDCDGATVPLVWQHMHNSADNVLGHAELEERDDGMYAYCTFNSTPSGQNAKELVRHGDIRSLSIYANHLRQQGGDVVHGMIREVSLVLSGANPGASIDNVSFAHSDGTYETIDDEAVITPGEGYLYHADETDETDAEESVEDVEDETVQEVFDTLSEKQKKAVYAIVSAVLEENEKTKSAEIEHADKPNDAKDSDDENEQVDKSNNGAPSEETIQDVFDTLNEKQKSAVYAIIGAALETAETDEVSHADDKEELSEEPSDKSDETIQDIFDTLSEKQKNAVYAIIGAALEDQQAKTEDEVKQSEFEGEYMKYNVFDEETNDTKVLTHSDMEGIFADAPRMGSLKEAALAHGITDIEVLFPEAQAVNAQPYQIARRMEWVSVVLNGVHKSPFSRIKSTAANLTEDQARAKGYVKGRKKIEEQITALRRVTTPQTIYKTQKLDRDDVIDITDFDVVAWMKQEMRMMLDEELARAILVGDGRLTSDPEKIFQDNIRSIWADNEMYTIHQVIPSANATDYTAMIDAVVRSRKGYKGSGNPVMFIGPTLLTEMRLLKDNDNRFRYESDAKLAEAMRVKAIHEVELFDELTRNVEGKKRSLVAIIVNLADYTVGCNKGGEVNLFDNFDLDYNKYQYLIETRCSGALTMPKSAIAIEIQTTTDASADPVYTLVTSPATADIAEYFEQDEYGRYFATEDEAVVAGKRYYIAG